MSICGALPPLPLRRHICSVASVVGMLRLRAYSCCSFPLVFGSRYQTVRTRSRRLFLPLLPLPLLLVEYCSMQNQALSRAGGFGYSMALVYSSRRRSNHQRSFPQTKITFHHKWKICIRTSCSVLRGRKSRSSFQYESRSR